MGMNKICPKCGSSKVELKDANKGHGFLKFIFFGIFYVMWLIVKWSIGLFILCCWDWWFAIIMRCCHKDYLWISKNFFANRKRYYCHECGYNFMA